MSVFFPTACLVLFFPIIFFSFLKKEKKKEEKKFEEENVQNEKKKPLFFKLAQSKQHQIKTPLLQSIISRARLPPAPE